MLHVALRVTLPRRRPLRARARRFEFALLVHRLRSAQGVLQSSFVPQRVRLEPIRRPTACDRLIGYASRVCTIHTALGVRLSVIARLRVPLGRSKFKTAPMHRTSCVARVQKG